MIPRIRTALVAITALLTFLRPALAASDDSYVTYQNPITGDTEYLLDDRRPALYTGNFGDCLGNSLINVTRFDAAYYKDNMTVLFHLEGNSALYNQSLMMYIGVYAYGESRFELTFNPCAANIASLCPINSSVPIEASGVIPVSEQNVANIPSLAYSIPDFEGQAVLRIFANLTESEIGCYSAVVTNGHSFSHPKAVGSVLGIFTFVALAASFLAAAYGEAIPTMRLHYAHSLSVGVVFAVFQHIFFTGALSMNWPSVLVAWWSNFAWAGGMIYSAPMQASINRLIGNNVGNTSQVGAAGSGTTQDDVGGGYDISLIYKRGLSYVSKHFLQRDLATEIYNRPADTFLRRDVWQRSLERTLYRRDLVNSSSGYDWYGHPVGEGLPLPGNYSGFAGTLGQENIRTSNAFMTGFLWFLILLVLLVAAVVALKWALEGLARIKAVKKDRLQFFRDHWIGYAVLMALRTCYLAFFVMMFLTIFQFTYDSSGGVKAIAAIVFVIFLVGIPTAAFLACDYKKKVDGSRSESVHVERKKLLGRIPWITVKRGKLNDVTRNSVPQEPSANPDSKTDSKDDSKGNFWRRQSTSGSYVDEHGQQHSIHDSEEYTIKYGWLASRFRRTRWWFFNFYIVYEFLRAIFYAGASGYPLAQVFGLLIIELFALCFVIWARPFEGQRLNILVVYFLGFSKVMSVGLSAAFNVDFNLQRITTTIIGIVIIIIQGVLTIITLIAIVVGAISSYMSVSRNREDFRPRKWAPLREKYFNHLDRVVNDLPRPPKPEPVKVEPAAPRSPYFEMKSVRRLAKIEDEDTDFASEMQTTGTPVDPAASYMALDEQRGGAATPVRAPSMHSTHEPRSGNASPTGRRSRAASMTGSTSNLPFGARAHRPSWSARDFASMQMGDGGELSYPPVDMSRHVPDDDAAENMPAPLESRKLRSPMRRSTMPSTVEPIPSRDILHVGGDVSTQDTIGSVPAPMMRPRAGTHGSIGSARATSSLLGEGPSGRYSEGDVLDDQWRQQQQQSMRPRGPSASQRASRMVPLTPAEEMEEWEITPKVSREH